MHLFALEMPKNFYFHYIKITLTCAWFYEMGFKYGFVVEVVLISTFDPLLFSETVPHST